MPWPHPVCDLFCGKQTSIRKTPHLFFISLQSPFKKFFFCYCALGRLRTYPTPPPSVFYFLRGKQPYIKNPLFFFEISVIPFKKFCLRGLLLLVQPGRRRRPNAMATLRVRCS